MTQIGFSTLRLPRVRASMHCVAVVLSWFAIFDRAATAVPFNVLMIAVDDLNDWVGPLGGHPQAHTPHLDRLAARSVTFTSAHCQAPICNPSRASLLTGRLPSSTGIYYLAPLLRNCEATRKSVTIPQHFQRSGYTTSGAGKIFHTADEAEFEEYGGTFGAFGPRLPKPIAAGHSHPLWDWGALSISDEEMPDAKIADWTADKLMKSSDERFLLACGFYRPHVPMYAPRKWFDKHPLEQVTLPPNRQDDLADVPSYARDLSWSLAAPRHDWMLENRQWRHAVQSYLASVRFVDAQIGKVLDALEESGAAESTVVVLWSDHGFHLGTKQRWGKRSLWEEATRVVLMVSVPDMPQGVTCDRPVGLVDIFPTLIDLCDLATVSGLQGHTLRPLLENPTADRPWPALTTFGQHNHAVRSQNWRYIRYADGSEELYNHRSDPNEFHNLANDRQYAEVIKEHRQWLPEENVPMAAGSAHADARPGSPPDIDNAHRAKRQSPPQLPTRTE